MNDLTAFTWNAGIPAVWVCNASARPCKETWEWLTALVRRHYGACIYRDNLDDDLINLVKASQAPIMLLSGPPPYPGYAVTGNACVREVFGRFPEARWAVICGDDTEMDPVWHPEHIALQLEAHFGGTFGVAQPVGDDWSDDMGPIIRRIAGSAWYGREYCRRIYSGKGPLWSEFQHMHVDEHARAVALKLGVYLELEHVTQMHRHFTRPGAEDKIDWNRPMPPHLVKWNTPEHWWQSKAIFDRLKAHGFAEALDLLPADK